MDKLTQAKEAYFDCDFQTAFKLFEELAADGNAEAQCFLGEFYDDFGNGFPVDFEKARELYERSWEQKFPRAATELYTIYADGNGVERDKKKAKEFLDAALELGDSLAKILTAFDLAGTENQDGKFSKLLLEAYDDPEFVRFYGNTFRLLAECHQKNAALTAELDAAKSEKESEKIMKKLDDLRADFRKNLEEENEKNRVPAQLFPQLFLATLFEDENPELAEKYYRQAAESGASSALANCAYFLCMHDKPGAAEMALKALEIIRSPRAMLTIGKCFLLGIDGLEQDEKRAETWLTGTLDFVDFEDDAKLVGEAYYWLGFLENVFRGNDEKALEYLKKSDKFGEVEATGKIAEILWDQEDPEAFPWAQKSEQAGHWKGAHVLAACYRDGLGTERDMDMFLFYAKMLADSEVSDGAFMLGTAAKYGLGLPKNDKQAIEFFELAEKLGDKSAAGEIAKIYFENDDPAAFERAKKGTENDDLGAMKILALCYRDGLGTKKDLKKFVKIARNLFDARDCDGAEMLGEAADYGNGLPQDDEKAIEYFVKADEWGSETAAGKIASILRTKNDPEAFLWAKKGAEKGDTLAMIGLEIFYLNGFGTEKSPREHLRIVKELIERDKALGLAELANDYFEGEILPKNRERALELYQESEKNGCDVAEKIAECHIESVHAKDDFANPDEAFKWAKLAVERSEENANAHYWLAICYLDGIGVPANPRKAFKHFQISADLGDARAKAVLDDDDEDADGNDD